jgi:hypothetical protein
MRNKININFILSNFFNREKLFLSFLIACLVSVSIFFLIKKKNVLIIDILLVDNSNVKIANNKIDENLPFFPGKTNLYNFKETILANNKYLENNFSSLGFDFEINGYSLSDYKLQIILTNNFFYLNRNKVFDPQLNDIKKNFIDFINYSGGNKNIDFFFSIKKKYYKIELYKYISFTLFLTFFFNIIIFSIKNKNKIF